ncbi:Putative F0F1-ATPase subunit Ca2+/Mg2+ transporter [Acetitomaculum ruminis DSM 5522]|uniref:Putative F0F1-ATPase subunit Ca2+/Mg2+ transporter n=1 Tax=Acetitomaculum ruminis DSM 5522 TaxID=1120918 RepID=A0A1I0YU52_9FIRM|nr:AtpZ/AtpI family protein [Acetitomaculum ruminis]SFB15970.1 Putative F0F1-ATPase subunit Ca2+/Mg2+ transporter [Acetitomaculum ruminis DSM 5522]
MKRRGYSEKNNNQIMKCLTMITQFGLIIIVSIGITSYIGMFFADKFDMPILVVPFFVLGCVAGFKGVYNMAKTVIGKEDNEKDSYLKKSRDEKND